jgi:nicotinate-nucleotide pyrophosphorylase (carboxylating)
LIDLTDLDNALWLPEVVRRALEEDIDAGDVTTQATIPVDTLADARIVARQPGVVAGLPVAREVYRQLSPEVVFACCVADGTRVRAGDALCDIAGPARPILTGERVALNFLQRLSGIATRTARFVELVAGTTARVVDTRKTTPGLRALEKYAVRAGGGHNHRMGLYDAVMIKDNHIVAAGGITAAVAAARTTIPHTMTITVECETLDEVREALSAGADILLLDNMNTATLAEAVSLARGRALTEASGGIGESTAAATARTGVDILSVGALTHSAPALDLGLDFLPPSP